MDFIDLKKQQSRIRDKIDKRIKSVLDHGKYIMGPEVFELEEKLSEYVGMRYCISCSSGTDALLIPLMANEIGPGDAVITTPFTYIATAEVISLLGAEPVFVDIYDSTYNMDPNQIEAAIKHVENKGLNTRAIIPVDLFGLPSRYRIISELANKHNLFILEDAAQGFGGEIRGQKAGSFGHVAATSFFPAKPLGCYGDGGAIFTNDDELAEKMKSIRIHGSGADKYQNVRIGINGRMDTFQAAILLEKLSIFNDELKFRNKVAQFYSSSINDDFIKPFIPKDYTSSWAQYSLIAKSKEHRYDVMNRLKEQGIPSMIYYKIPMHLQEVFHHLNYKENDFLISEKISSQIFSLPMHPYLKKTEQEKIIEVVNS